MTTAKHILEKELETIKNHQKNDPFLVQNAMDKCINSISHKNFDSEIFKEPLLNVLQSEYFHLRTAAIRMFLLTQPIHIIEAHIHPVIGKIENEYCISQIVKSLGINLSMKTLRMCFEQYIKKFNVKNKYKSHIFSILLNILENLELSHHHNDTMVNVLREILLSDLDTGDFNNISYEQCLKNICNNSWPVPEVNVSTEEMLREAHEYWGTHQNSYMAELRREDVEHLEKLLNAYQN